MNERGLNAISVCTSRNHDHTDRRREPSTGRPPSDELHEMWVFLGTLVSSTYATIASTKLSRKGNLFHEKTYFGPALRTEDRRQGGQFWVALAPGNADASQQI